MTEGSNLPLPPISPQRPDGAFLHFLKELPAWCVIGIFVGAFLGTWQLSHDDFIPRIIDGLVGALLAVIVSNKSRQPTISAGQISTGDVLPGPDAGGALEK